jgi:hypothetical protein
MFNSREYLLDDLTQAIFNGVITDELYFEAKQKANTLKAVKDKQRQQSAETQRLKQLEALKPCNAIPRLSRFEHVTENAREYHEYVDTCDLALLEVYRDEMVNGQHKPEFRNDAHFQRVLTFLTLKIQQRKASLDPIQERNKLLREAKVERSELKKQTEGIERKLRETTLQLDNAKNAVKNDLKPTDESEKVKQYAT